MICFGKSRGMKEYEKIYACSFQYSNLGRHFQKGIERI